MSHNQCTAVYVKHRGRHVTAVFCVKPHGHDGPHKGFRKQWQDGDGEQSLTPEEVKEVKRMLDGDK